MNFKSIIKLTLVIGLSNAESCMGNGILYPQDSEIRETKDLGGMWNFRLAPKLDPDLGFRNNWYKQLWSEPGDILPMPVPSSYNDITQNATIRDHIGWAWYQTDFFVPRSWSSQNQRIVLRFGSVHYTAEVWVNGQHVAHHEGGHLPFQTDVTKFLNSTTSNLLTVAVNNTLTPETIPQGEIHYKNDSKSYPVGYFVQTYYFDFRNYAGIHRKVVLYTTPKVYIDDITVTTVVHNHTTATVNYKVVVGPSGLPSTSTCYVVLVTHCGKVVASAKGVDGSLSIENVNLWWPYTMSSTPAYLYTLKVTLAVGSEVEDIYRLKIGIRTITWDNKSLLINSKPFYFRGFGRHEDYNIRGKGLDYPSIAKDFNLIKWTGANSFRTSHYPYAEEILDLADREGIVIIDESPAIGLQHFDKQLLDKHISVMQEFVQRDKNRPSVVMWSLGNEPVSNDAAAGPYFKEVVERTRQLDPTRPLTVVLDVPYSSDLAAQYLDVICINRYYGWYSDTGHLEVIQKQIMNEVLHWNKKFDKPVIVSEYGAESITGMHSAPPAVFSEEYQVAFFNEYFLAFDALRKQGPFIGEMLWNFADFMTEQELNSVHGNKKGIFTRERQPKSSAHTIRNRYWQLAKTLDKCKNLPGDLLKRCSSGTNTCNVY